MPVPPFSGGFVPEWNRYPWSGVYPGTVGRLGSSSSGLWGDGPRRGGGREGSSCSGIRGDGPRRGGGREGSSSSGSRGNGPRRGGGREGSSSSGSRGNGPRRGGGREGGREGSSSSGSRGNGPRRGGGREGWRPVFRLINRYPFLGPWRERERESWSEREKERERETERRNLGCELRVVRVFNQTSYHYHNLLRPTQDVSSASLPYPTAAYHWPADLLKAHHAAHAPCAC